MFPVIKNIEDVLLHIDDNFSVKRHDNVTVVNYILSSTETFPTDISLKSKIRRECRGLIFDNKTGNIIRRPLHKFFNVGERESTQINNVNFSEQHDILEKLDGSMIAPFYNGEKMYFGTKAGFSEVADFANSFVGRNSKYTSFSDQLILYNFTPIFEYVSKNNKIVLKYSEENMYLLAIRNIFSGEYLDYETMKKWANIYDIPLVNRHNTHGKSINEIFQIIKDSTDEEGIVIRFPHEMMKVKCDWYVAIHKAKEKILFDRHIVEMILNEDIDDIKSHLDEDDRKSIDEFENSFWKHFKEIKYRVDDMLMMYPDKTEFGRFHKNNYSSFYQSLYFYCMSKEASASDALVEIIKKNLNQNISWENFSRNNFFGLKRN